MNQKKSPDNPKQKSGKRKEILAKGALYTMVCLWMFVLGVLVGRGTAPVRFDIPRLQDELAALKATTTEKTIQRYRIAFEELDKEKDLGFHEALKDEETDLGQAVLPAVDTPASKASDEAEVIDVPPKKTKGPDFQKPSAVETPEAWAIQVAATQDQGQGDQLVERLEKMGYRAYLTRAVIPGKGTWYRIQVGGYASRDAAETDLERLKKEQFSPFIVSPRG